MWQIRIRILVSWKLCQKTIRFFCVREFNRMQCDCACACVVACFHTCVDQVQTQSRQTHTNNIHSTDTSHFHSNCDCVFDDSCQFVDRILAKCLSGCLRYVTLFSLTAPVFFSSLEPPWKVTVVIVQYMKMYLYMCMSRAHRHTDTEPSKKHTCSFQFPSG